MLWHGRVHILVYNNLYLWTSFTKAMSVMKLHRVKRSWCILCLYVLMGWNSDFICPFNYSVGVCSVILRDRLHTAGNQLQSHQYESETTDDQHYSPLLLFTLHLAEEQRFFWGREFCFKRDDYFCVNLCWVLQHRVKQRKQRGCAACGRKSRDTEGLCKVKGVGAYKVGHLTHSIAGPLWCHADIITPRPHLPYSLLNAKTIYIIVSHTVALKWKSILFWCYWKKYQLYL